VEVRLRAEDVPVTSRREYWQHVFETVTVPYRLKGTGSDFRSRMDASEFGPARLVRADAPPGEALRTPKQVRRAAPDQRMIVVQVHGSTVWGQDDRECVLSPGDLAFIDLARPHWSALRSAGVANVRFPGQLMPLRRNEADRLCGVHFDARDDSVSLASKLVREVARDFDRQQVASRARIGSAVLDLVIAALASRVESTSPAAADSAHVGAAHPCLHRAEPLRSGALADRCRSRPRRLGAIPAQAVRGAGGDGRGVDPAATSRPLSARAPRPGTASPAGESDRSQVRPCQRPVVQPPLPYAQRASAGGVPRGAWRCGVDGHHLTRECSAPRWRR